MDAVLFAGYSSNSTGSAFVSGDSESSASAVTVGVGGTEIPLRTSKVATSCWDSPTKIGPASQTTEAGSAVGLHAPPLFTSVRVKPSGSVTSTGVITVAESPLFETLNTALPELPGTTSAVGKAAVTAISAKRTVSSSIVAVLLVRSGSRVDEETVAVEEI